MDAGWPTSGQYNKLPVCQIWTLHDVPSYHSSSLPLLALYIVPSRLANINILLRIFCTLPVSTCTAERAFSAMKLIKTYLRKTMTDERLTALALMYIHPEIDINVEQVIDRFLDKPVTRKFTNRHKWMFDITVKIVLLECLDVGPTFFFKY